MTQRSPVKTGTGMAATVAPYKRRPMRPRRSGRPTRHTAERLREHILTVATGLFLHHGYGATSIEEVARRARISKRTFYHRFADKAALFAAVVHGIIDRLHPPADVPLLSQVNLQENLLRLARLMLQAAVTPQAVALHRLIIAESARFPELAVIAGEQGGIQEAVSLVAGLLERETYTEHLAVSDPVFAARQFLQMVVSLPQRRAMGLGMPMTPQEIDAWVNNTVDLFLNGCRGGARP
ncbi:MAG: TetR/AcrR family transcriptional regulator [Gammaproteobacteria bacterium]